MGKITLLTGEFQSGKTNLCLEVIQAARESGIQVGGVVSPGVFLAGEKTAIDLLNVGSGERTRLAERKQEGGAELSTRRWAFLPEAVTWGNQVLEKAVPCDVLIVDELGPLEFQRGEGWVNGFKTIASGNYKAALVVIRPSLLEEALSRWDVARIIDLDDPEETLRSGRSLLQALLQENL